MLDMYPTGKEPKILIVADEYLIALDQQLSLLTLGYRDVKIVTSEEPVLDRIQEEAPDLIVLNVRSDSVRAHEAVRKAGVAILYLSAHAPRRIGLTHDDRYLMRPFSNNSLRKAIEGALNFGPQSRPALRG